MLERFWKRMLRRKSASLWWLTVPVFWLCSLVYRLGVRLRRTRARVTVKTRTPVISVGNISVGGTGKTPAVDMLARLLLAEGFRVGIVSSAYGRKTVDSFVEPGWQVENMATTVTGDEVKYLATRLPEAMFAVDEVKAEAAGRLDETGEVDVMIVDDGFQHAALHRHLDIVTYDAAVKARTLRMFPLGVLREPLSAMKRADIIIITRANFARDISRLHRKLHKVNREADVFHAQFLVDELIGRERTLPVKYLQDKSVFLFAGIGNFRSLRQQVDALAGDLDVALELSDHQNYTPDVLARIARLAEDYESDVLVTTGKDWVKLGDFDFGREIYYLAQSVDLDPGEERLLALVLKRLGLQKRND